MPAPRKPEITALLVELARAAGNRQPQPYSHWAEKFHVKKSTIRAIVSRHNFGAAICSESRSSECIASKTLLDSLGKMMRQRAGVDGKKLRVIPQDGKILLAP